jgi:hypothetical protein
MDEQFKKCVSQSDCTKNVRRLFALVQIGFCGYFGVVEDV